LGQVPQNRFRSGIETFVVLFERVGSHPKRSWRAKPIVSMRATYSGVRRFLFIAKALEGVMKNTNSSTAITAAIALSILNTLASAQVKPPPPVPGTPGCLTELVPKDESNLETRGQGGENLSEKLSKSEGVICPPRSVDPEITVRPPGGGVTPIIPPPGTPGGDPNVRPK